jgi:hypothetical protein
MLFMMEYPLWTPSTGGIEQALLAIELHDPFEHFENVFPFYLP